MTTDRVMIEEFLLHLPGLPADAARQVAAEVAARVGRGLEDAGPARDLGALEITVTARAGASRDELVDLVATAILRGLVR